MIMDEDIFKTNPNNKLLMISILMLVLIKPAIDFLVGHFGLDDNHYVSLIEQIILIVILCISVIKIGEIRLSQIGVDVWKNWDVKNKRIFFIVTPIILIAFSFLFISFSGR